MDRLLSELTGGVAESPDTIGLDSENDIAPAVYQIKLAGLDIGFQSYDLARICLAASEMLTNAIRYAGQAELQISPSSNGKGIELIIRDHGPGIEDLAWAEVDGNTSWPGRSLGLGLGAARRCVDDMYIETNDAGTVVRLRSFLAVESHDIEHAFITFPAVDKLTSAESVSIKEFNGDCLLAVLVAGGSNAEIRDHLHTLLNAAKYHDLVKGLIQAHEYLKREKEMGISIGLIRVTPSRIQALSTGNVTVQFCTGHRTEKTRSLGDLGLFLDTALPGIDVLRRPNSQLFMCSPGLQSPAWPDGHENLSAKSIARQLFNHYSQAAQDSSVVVVRCIA